MSRLGFGPRKTPNPGAALGLKHSLCLQQSKFGFLSSRRTGYCGNPHVGPPKSPQRWPSHHRFRSHSTQKANLRANDSQAELLAELQEERAAAGAPGTEGFRLLGEGFKFGFVASLRHSDFLCCWSQAAGYLGLLGLHGALNS